MPPKITWYGAGSDGWADVKYEDGAKVQVWVGAEAIRRLADKARKNATGRSSIMDGKMHASVMQ